MRRQRETRGDGIAVEATVHRKAKRMNIPTSELGGFVAAEEHEPQAIVYPRDLSLDPQLVWRGKDEQDSHPLEVLAVPIYIQEKVAPQVIIENLRSQTRRDAQQPDLFADFNGIPFAQMVEFYQHKQNWSNRLILGDSLLVMTSLAEKEGLKGQVQCIYLDPPYGIDFGSNWQISTRKRDVRDGRTEELTRQPEQVKAFRDTWELGIHSYLAYLRDRLAIARELLSDGGSVFVQIGDENVHLVRALLDEVFGRANAVVTIVVKKKGGQRSGYLDPVNDYLLWYSKTPRGQAGAGPKYRPLFERRELDADTLGEFSRVELADGSSYSIAATPGPEGEEVDYRLRPQLLFIHHPGARLFRAWPITNGGERANQMDPVELVGKEYLPPSGRCWSHTSRSTDGSLSGMDKVKLAGRLVASGEALDFKRYLDDFPYKIMSNWWDSLGGPSNPIFVVQTNTEVVKRCILMTTDPGDLVLDPTCGSGTTAYVAEEWGRRWITIDTSRVALALTRQRLMAGRYPYYVLADSPQGLRLAAEMRGDAPAFELPPTHGDISKGFVYQVVTRLTSSSIANNPDIREGMSPEEIDLAIRRHTETETLFDQPSDDRTIVRVTGSFTVESLSPHRVIAPDPGGALQAPSRDEVENDGKFRRQIIDNLRFSGVQNTVRKERLVFKALEEWPGTYIQAAGDYEESETLRRAAIAIGPEHGTVDAQFVREAAKEAVQNAFDVLVVCGYAFDAQVETIGHMGRLTILRAAINPDMQFGGDLLKKSGTANLFTVFGEPDVLVRDTPDGVVVEVRGIDVYDPTTGEIRSNSTDDIACWFIDTDYNAESFFVRHAYFTGTGDPYAQLKRALRADVNEDAWASLYRTMSQPFPKPSTGKIAVKVINHYGDEVMKVYDAANFASETPSHHTSRRLLSG